MYIWSLGEHSWFSLWNILQTCKYYNDIWKSTCISESAWVTSALSGNLWVFLSCWQTMTRISSLGLRTWHILYWVLLFSPLSPLKNALRAQTLPCKGCAVPPCTSRCSVGKSWLPQGPWQSVHDLCLLLQGGVWIPVVHGTGYLVHKNEQESKDIYIIWFL